MITIVTLNKEMALYRAVMTLSWKYESDKPHAECMQELQEQADRFVPEIPNLEDFSMHLAVTQMKQRKILVHLAEFTFDDLFPHITDEETRREFSVGEKKYFVKMNSERYHLFKTNRTCGACGLEGTKLMLDWDQTNDAAHFNLYAEENGRLVMMTKDHVLARSVGGLNHASNYVTCCSTCNNLKSNFTLTYEQIKDLRQLHNNPRKLPKKELRELINKRRSEYHEFNLRSEHEA
jgi:5-methylcytosine-specific restriction endonuclease McrA